MPVRFDDSLDTVLASETTGAGAVQSVWRQLVDLIGRRRSEPRPDALIRLQAIRGRVPIAVRAATARSLERADPPAALVGLFIHDEHQVAAPLARSARLTAEEWLALLPAMRPATRGVLRHRRDLPAAVVQALASFGPTDFALPAGVVTTAAPAAVTLATETTEPDPDPLPVFFPPEPDPFTAVAEIARDLPVVATARQLEAESPRREDFEITAIVARIEAHQRAADVRPLHVTPIADGPADRFRFETDARGLIRWCDGVERGAVIGLSLTAGRDGTPAVVDGAAGGAFARRAPFNAARLRVTGGSDAAGDWRISGIPAFDRGSGRFTGYRGTARRPRADEAPRVMGPSAATDALRQLVHELRTPANAISGFAEMIEEGEVL